MQKVKLAAKARQHRLRDETPKGRVQHGGKTAAGTALAPHCKVPGLAP